MDDIKDIIDDIKARLNNPLIASVIIAWLIFNWYIPVSLIFYTQKELSLDGFKSYKAVIQHETNLWRNFIFPLLSATIYVLFMPYIRGWIKAYQAKALVSSENKVLIANNAILTFKSQLDQKDQLIELRNEEIIRNNQMIVHQAEGLENMQALISDLELNKSSLIKKTEQNALLNSPLAINGKWVVDIIIGGRSSRTEWLITDNKIADQNGNYYRISKRLGYDYSIWFKLRPQNKPEVELLTLEIHPETPNKIDGILNLETKLILSRVVNS